MSLVSLVSLQLLLYAVLWLLAAVAFRTGRAAMLHWCAYALASTLATGLLALRASHPGWLSIAGASFAFLLSLVLVRRGVDLFLKLPPRDLAYGTVMGSALLGLWLIGIDPSAAWQRIMLASSLSLVVMLAQPSNYWRAIRSEFGSGMALAAAFAVLAMALLHSSQLLLAWRNPEAMNLVARDASAMPSSTWVVVLVSAAVFNFLFVFLVAMRLVNKLRDQARHDPLTGLLNRRAMSHVLASEWLRLQRGGPSFTLIGVDLDHFKRINDQHGHAGGDEVLREVARRLKGALRPIDRLARMGGEELMVLLPGCEAPAAGQEAALRLRAVLNQAPVALGAGLHLAVTASWGVAGPQAQDSGFDAVIARADAALYQAKATGRDRVVLAGLAASA